MDLFQCCPHDFRNETQKHDVFNCRIKFARNRIMLTLNKRPLLILRDAGKGFCFVFIRFVLFLERVRKYQTIVRLGSKNKSCGKVPKK